MPLRKIGISVVIPTYNRARVIRKAIDSVLQQTRPADEILVVDDGSRDETGKVLVSYGRRIRVIGQANLGPSAARNRGLREAKHDIVAFLDSDDAWLPRKLEIQCPLMENPQVVLSYTNWQEAKDVSGQDYFSKIGFAVPRENIIDMPLKTLARPGGSGIWTTTCMARKEAVLRVGGFDERMRIAEDIRLWFRLGFEGKFAVTGVPLAQRSRTHTAEQLTQEHSPAYFRESARSRMEVFWETYARAVDAPRDVQRLLRRFVAESLVEQSRQLALEADYPSARRKALESLGFLPAGKFALRAMVGLVLPSAFRLTRKEKKKS